MFSSAERLMSPGVSSYAHPGGTPEGCEEEWIVNIKQCLQCCLFMYELIA